MGVPGPLCNAQAHNPKVAGSNPAPAIPEAPANAGVSAFQTFLPATAVVPRCYQHAPRRFGGTGLYADARGQGTNRPLSQRRELLTIAFITCDARPSIRFR